MRFIADFHIHSKYSRATSKDMDPLALSKWARMKGISLLGTGDFTHPSYFAELGSLLEPDGNGFFTLKKGDKDIHFMLTGEVCNIFSKNGSVRRIHNLIFCPDFTIAEKLNSRLSRLGKLGSDGRPIFGFSARDLVRLIMDISEEFAIIPAHAWTPWFSIFGANSGFNSIEECFEDESKHIFAIETGLSSDPQMNWRISALDRITLISNSDAHSPPKIGREANVFDCPMNYKEIIDALRKRDSKRFLHTIEFFPEEGKYHYDGHRVCNVLLSPKETRKNNNICPVCKKKITIGVMHRVEELADRPEGYMPQEAIPAKHLIPLAEIIAESLNVGVETASVDTHYRNIISHFGNEFAVLLDLKREELSHFLQPRMLEGIMRMREGKIKIIPGYDGVYGKIRIFGEEENIDSGGTQGPEQMSLF